MIKLIIRKIEKTPHNTVYNLLLGSCLFTKILSDFLFGFYLLKLRAKPRNKPYTNTLATIVHEQNSGVLSKVVSNTNVSDLI